MRPRELVGERLAVAADGCLARRGTRVCCDPGRYAAPLPVITMRPRPRSSMPRDHGAAREVHAEHVHLEHVPPGVDRDLPGRRRPGCRCPRSRRAGRSARAPLRCGSTQRSTSSLSAHVADEGEPADLARDRFDLLGRPPGHRHTHACVGELTRDRRTDPAAAAGDERDALEPVRRHARSPRALRDSRAWRGRPDPARARAPARRAARSSRSASSEGPSRRGRGRARTPSRARAETAAATSSAVTSAPGTGTQ